MRVRVVRRAAQVQGAKAMFKPTETVEIVVPEWNLYLEGTIRYADNLHLVINCPSNNTASLPTGTVIQVLQALNGNLYQMNTPLLRAQENVIAVALVAPQLVQRRARPRVECVLSAWYTYDSRGRSGERCLGIVRDLSVGGARLCVAQRLPTSAELELEIELDLGFDPSLTEWVSCPATIMRCKELAGPDTAHFPDMHYALAVRFGAISRMCQVKMQRFIQNPPPVTEKLIEKYNKSRRVVSSSNASERAA